MLYDVLLWYGTGRIYPYNYFIGTRCCSVAKATFNKYQQMYYANPCAYFSGILRITQSTPKNMLYLHLLTVTEFGKSVRTYRDIFCNRFFLSISCVVLHVMHRIRRSQAKTLMMMMMIIIMMIMTTTMKMMTTMTMTMTTTTTTMMMMMMMMMMLMMLMMIMDFQILFQRIVLIKSLYWQSVKSQIITG